MGRKDKCAPGTSKVVIGMAALAVSAVAAAPHMPSACMLLSAADAAAAAAAAVIIAMVMLAASVQCRVVTSDTVPTATVVPVDPWHAIEALCRRVGYLPTVAEAMNPRPSQCRC